MKRINTFESLGLSAALEQANAHLLPLQWVPWVNILSIGLGLFLSASRWLCPPGVQLDLPEVSTITAYQTVLPVGDVLLVDAEGRIFFHHKLYTWDQLSTIFDENHLESPILLLKIDQKIPLIQVVQLVDVARAHGYQHIQIAVNAKDENS